MGLLKYELLSPTLRLSDPMCLGAIPNVPFPASVEVMILVHKPHLENHYLVYWDRIN